MGTLTRFEEVKIRKLPSPGIINKGLRFLNTSQSNVENAFHTPRSPPLIQRIDLKSSLQKHLFLLALRRWGRFAQILCCVTITLCCVSIKLCCISIIACCVWKSVCCVPGIFCCGSRTVCCVCRYGPPYVLTRYVI